MKKIKNNIIIYIIALIPMLFATTSCSDIPPLDEWLTAKGTTTPEVEEEEDDVIVDDDVAAEDDEVVEDEVITTYNNLSDFSATSYPTDSDTWTILDSSASSVSDFDGLQAALATAKDNDREISLQFSNLESIPSAFSVTNGAFYDCTALISVESPSLTTIGDYAFSDCSAIASVDFPLLTTLGGYAFNSCKALTNVELPLVVTLGGAAFDSCTTLYSLELPSVTTIGSIAFNSCTALTSIELATATDVKISSINATAFEGVTTTNITLNIGSANSSSVSGNTLTVGSKSWTFKEILIDGVEAGYENLADFSATSYPTDSDTWTILDSEASDVSLFDGLQAALGSAATAGREISLLFPNLTEITSASSDTDGALYLCRYLISVELPLATSIGDFAFYSCSTLASLEIPKATSIGDSAFKGCSALTGVELPLVTSIGAWAFYSCDVLSSVVLPLVTSIGGYAFEDSTSLTSVEVATGSGVTISSISSSAFYNVTTTNISLNIGSANSDYVSGNTLTVGSNSWAFKEILIDGVVQESSTGTEVPGFDETPAW